MQINTRTVFGVLEPSKFDIASRRKNFVEKKWGAYLGILEEGRMGWVLMVRYFTC